MKQISKVLKGLRTKAKVKQADLTKISGIDIKQIESGKKKPTPKEIAKICKALKIPKEVALMYSLELKDIPKHKQDLWKKLAPALKGLINQLAFSK